MAMWKLKDTETVEKQQKLMIARREMGGGWVKQVMGIKKCTQLVKHPAFEFGLGHNLTVGEFKPHIGLSAVSAEPNLDSLSPSMSAFSLSLSNIN